MQVLAEGIRQADALDSAQVADAIRNNVIETMLKPLQFEPDGDVVDAQIWIYQVVDGEFTQVQ
jgi:ABC-type branched-subunit amino acid transport system substrate-binding protein